MLGWCCFLDQAPYDAVWYASLPSPGLAPTESVGEMLSLANLTDEQMVARFVEQVACAGAFLAYLGEEYNPTLLALADGRVPGSGHHQRLVGAGTRGRGGARGLSGLSYR